MSLPKVWGFIRGTYAHFPKSADKAGVFQYGRAAGVDVVQAEPVLAWRTHAIARRMARELLTLFSQLGESRPMKRTHLSIAAAVFAAALASAEAPLFQFAAAGRAKAVIVAEPGTNGYAYAANELAKYLGKITGATFMVADRPVKGFRTIQVGAPYKASRPEELCVRFKDRDTLEFTGDGPLGTLYAVYASAAATTASSISA